MIQYGRDDNDFYIEFKSKSREVGNIRQEFEIRARQLYEENDNIVLGISGGLDSQVMMHSFFSQGLNVKTSFMYVPNCNFLTDTTTCSKTRGCQVIDDKCYYDWINLQ